MAFSPARFKKLSTTAALEFQRLLRAGEGPLLHLPEQHGATVREILSKHGLVPSDTTGISCELSYKVEHGFWAPRAKWSASKKTSKLPQQAISALCLQLLFANIQSGWYRSQPLEGRLAFRNELLVLWWDLLVIPELEARGHSRQQSENSARMKSRAGQIPATTQSIRDFLKKLKQSGRARDDAKEALMDRYGMGVSRANKLLADAGYLAQRGRKPKSRQVERRN
jgi:hypothetical protein